MGKTTMAYRTVESWSIRAHSTEGEQSPLPTFHLPLIHISQVLRKNDAGTGSRAYKPCLRTPAQKQVSARSFGHSCTDARDHWVCSPSVGRVKLRNRGFVDPLRILYTPLTEAHRGPAKCVHPDGPSFTLRSSGHRKISCKHEYCRKATKQRLKKLLSCARKPTPRQKDLCHLSASTHQL